MQGFAPVESATPHLAPAVDGADVIIVVTGSTFHAQVASDLAKTLRDGQTILLIQGGTGGSLLVRQDLARADCRARVDVAEMDNFPDSLAWPEPTRVRMTIVKRFLQIAALPAARVGAVLDALRPAFPQAVAAPSILATGLTNMNAVLHVVNMVGNVGRLEGSGNEYRFYAEGYTPSLVTLLEALDAERLAVAWAFGLQVPGVHEWLLRTYDLGGDSLGETFHRLTHQPTGPYQWTPTPRSLDHKYVTEDVPWRSGRHGRPGRRGRRAHPGDRRARRSHLRQGCAAISARRAHSSAWGSPARRRPRSGRSPRSVQLDVAAFTWYR